LEHDKQNIWIAGIFYGIAVYLLLILLQPFGIDSSGAVKYVQLLLFAFVTWLGVVVAYLLLKLISKDFFADGKWTVGKEITFNFLVVCFILIGNFIAFIVLYHISLNAYTIGTVCWQTIVTAACIIGLKIILTQKKTANPVLKDETSATREHVRINGSGKNDQLTIPLDDMLYIESDKNYCRIVTKTDHLQIRLTMSSAEEQLQKYDSLIRCHRAYIINKSKVICMEGGATVGYKLKLSGVENPIPVGRSYTQNIKAIFGE